MYKNLNLKAGWLLHLFYTVMVMSLWTATRRNNTANAFRVFIKLGGCNRRAFSISHRRYLAGRIATRSSACHVMPHRRKSRYVVLLKANRTRLIGL
jgi:hypothetical protein